MTATTLPPPEELDRLATMDPEIEAVVKKDPRFANPLTDIPDPVKYVHLARAGYAQMTASGHDEAVTETKSTYETRDGATLNLNIYKAAQPAPDKPSPLLVWYHGGGLCIGSPEMNTTMYRQLIKTHNFTIVAPTYRLAPEHKWPAQGNDAWDAFAHITAHITTFSADPASAFLIGGESAGAMLAALVALQARDAPTAPPLTGQYLSAGSYVAPQAVPEAYAASYVSRDDPRCRSSPFLSWPAKSAFDACAQPDYQSPLYRAALWGSGFAGLPKVYFQACGMDILRDDGFIYRDMLSEAGVETKMDVYPGAPHCFWMAGWDVAATKKWRGDMERGWEWLLQ